MRIGLDQTFHSIRNEVFSYKSVLNQENEGNALLDLLWSHKDSMKSFTMVCLDHLLEIINSDEAIQEWFAKLPGVTY